LEKNIHDHKNKTTKKLTSIIGTKKNFPLLKYFAYIV